MKVNLFKIIRRKILLLKIFFIIKKTDGRVKDEKLIINKGFSKNPFGKHYGYGHEKSSSIFDVSLPCSVESCRFSGVSKIYDKYLPELKHCLLTSNNKYTAVDKMKFS